MYHVLLTNRYLTSRVIPLIAVAAVALCVALVIIVVSVMTGFLDMVKNSGRTLVGDVVLTYSVSGFPHYERLIERIEALPEAKVATPVVDGWGLLKMPYPDGDHKTTETVQFWAVEAESFAAVTGYADTLYWRPPTPEELEAMSADDFRRDLLARIGEDGFQLLHARGLSLEAMEIDGTPTWPIVLGMHVSDGNERQKDGSYRPIRNGYWWMPRYNVVLTTLPLDSMAVPEPVSVPFKVANEFISGVFLIDDKRVIIPLAAGQKLLRLDGAELVDDEGVVTGRDPPRATTILVRAVDGVTPDALQERISVAYEEFRRELFDEGVLPAHLIPPIKGLGTSVQTWLEQQAQFIAPVEKERELMRILFSIIYLVCAGLVLSIFWAIVYEKTRDIGILRSIGASRLGISLIFLRYGAIIGTAGALLGCGLAVLIIRNINTIHYALGEPAPKWLWAGLFVLAGGALVATVWRLFHDLLLPLVLWTLALVVVVGIAVLLMLHQGTQIWSAEVYYFTEIPNKVDVLTAIWTMIFAIVFSVLGAFFPAAKAADTDPVKALRYE